MKKVCKVCGLEFEHTRGRKYHPECYKLMNSIRGYILSNATQYAIDGAASIIRQVKTTAAQQPHGASPSGNS